MRLLKKITVSILLVILTIPIDSASNNLTTVVNGFENHPVKVSVLLNYNIEFLKLLAENMEKVEQENPGTVQYTFYDGKGNQQIQDNQLNDVLIKKDTDLIIIDIADSNYTKDVINKIKENNIPVIFAYNGDRQAIKSYNKAFLASIDPAAEGVAQGNIVIDAWNKHIAIIDKNQDNTLEYIMLLGPQNSAISDERSKYSISTINKNIKSKELGSKNCNWSQDEAKEAVSQFYLRFGDRIEAIIAASDDLAIGAVNSLQEYGYNSNSIYKKVLVLGYDGIPPALDLIKNGNMTGTILQDPYVSANYFYTIGMNLINHKNPVDGTDCTIDTSEQLITLPYNGVFVNLNYT